MSVRFAFFGSDAIAIPVLNELEKGGFVPVVIVCAEDNPQGRGLTITPPPAKVWAGKHNIPVLQPQKLDTDFVLQLKAYNPQLGVVASYGKIIPREVFDIPTRGTLNVHPSLLPKLRGPAPIQCTILSGEKPGVSIILIDEEMDHGPILAQKAVVFGDEPPAYTEAEKILGSEGGKLLASVIPDWMDENIKAQTQDHTLATFTKKISKEDAEMDMNDGPIKNLRKIHAFEKWPGAYFFHSTKNGKVRVKIKEAHIKEGVLVLDRVTPEGRKEMSWQDFLRGVM